MAKELAKQYDPKDVEDRIYKTWLDGKYFHAECDSKKKPYTIVIPPPNITGQLHMGHALDNTLQDILSVSDVCRALIPSGFPVQTTLQLLQKQKLLRL